MEDRDISQHILVKEEIIKQPQVVVNGVPQQEVEMPQTILVCPNCGRVIQAFQVGVPKIEIIKAITQDANFINQMNDVNAYCPKCGQKLDYTFDIVEGEYSVEDIPQEEEEVKGDA